MSDLPTARAEPKKKGRAGSTDVLTTHRAHNPVIIPRILVTGRKLFPHFFCVFVYSGLFLS